MANSEAFADIKLDILNIVNCIPKGKVTTYKTIGNYLDVIPRQVAYILTILSDEEKQSHPWYRVIGEKAKLGKAKYDANGKLQDDLLVDEGHSVDKGLLLNVEQVFITVEELNTGIVKHKYYKENSNVAT